MCGIFGYHGTGSPDPLILRAAASGAGRRGPHGYGFAFRRPDGALYGWHEIGPVNLDRLPQVGFNVILGHARLATVGDWRQREQLQPIVVDQHAIAHNGVISNPDDLTPHCVTDSIALAQAYGRLRREDVTPWEALEKLIASAEQRAWAIAVLDSSGPIYVHRHYHPLYSYRDDRGTYLSSQPFHDGATELGEDRVVALT